jgi:2-polyprenyl-3-methyl-5-hydroxy-6-metoxy-1,4-benzoquinol methylase
MPIQRCAACGDASRQRLFAVEQAPVFHIRPAAAPRRPDEMAALDIVSCARCGHCYNAAFDDGRTSEIYAGPRLTNAPVHASMAKSLDETAELLVSSVGSAASLLEIGGGSCYLALAMARHVRSVDLVEPSAALDEAALSAANITLHRAMFPCAALETSSFDLIVCRQVLEHVPEALSFLSAIRARLSPGGIAYVEVPRLEYIAINGSIADFHYPHVHYFSDEVLTSMMRTAGLEIVRVLPVKSGHDAGYVLRVASPGTASAAAGTRSAALATLLDRRRAQGAKRLAATAGPVALYGATAYSQALLGLYPELRDLDVAFDDTVAYHGQQIYGGRVAVAIEPRSRPRLAALGTVIITAYLHDAVIYRKLLEMGFAGTVYSLRCDEAAGRDGRPHSLFLD